MQKYYVALGKCHYKAHVVILFALTNNRVFLLLLSVFTTRYSTHTLKRCNSLGMDGLQEIASWNQGADSARNCCRPQESKHGVNIYHTCPMLTQKFLILKLTNLCYLS